MDDRSLQAVGARGVGVDLSDCQLHRARALSRAIPLVQGSAREPFRFEAGRSTWCSAITGATVFAPPQATVPEASRVLRSERLVRVLHVQSPSRYLLRLGRRKPSSRSSPREDVSLSAFDDGESVEYQLPYGEWIRLFRRHELDVEDLIELQAPDDATTTFADFVPATWARRWPAEHIWKLRKRG